MPELCQCLQCGAQLPEDTPGGLCAECRLMETMAPESDSKSGQDATVFSQSPPQDVPSELQKIAAHFPQLEFIELLGQGGMGVVYKVRQLGLDRVVALKILLPGISHDPAFAQRFTRKARALAKLNHSGILTIYDVGQSGELYYFLMEYVDGANLRQLLRNGKLNPEEALRIVSQICDALQYAHDQGVVHRDIKPANILLNQKGQVKIADFGLAKLVGQPTSDSALTGSLQVMGTLHYMAPEQMERPLEVDHRADIYSLGVVFYEMLTGELPLGRFAPPSRKAAVDVRLDEVVLRALTKEPAERYQQVSEVRMEVETLTRGTSPSDASGQPRSADVPGGRPPGSEDSVGDHLERLAQAVLPTQMGAAVKTYRERTRVALREAKGAVESLARHKHVGRITGLWKQSTERYGMWFGVGVVLVAAVILGLSSWLLILAFGAVVAWRFRRIFLGRMLALMIGAALYVMLVGNLNWLYAWTGREDSLFLLAAYTIGGPLWLVWLWRTLRPERKIAADDRTSQTSPEGANAPNQQPNSIQAEELPGP